ncbi:MAG: cytidine deaminase [Pyrinomonadaceae bacterium]
MPQEITDMMILKDLIEAASAAREHAYAPYSRFRIGAAVETGDGRIFTGCNIESSTYGLTICAERVALWKALSEGIREFKRIVIVADTKKLVPPCGACRQIVSDFCSAETEVVMANSSGEMEIVTIERLLPSAFDHKFLPS